jgi:hypothetical protein
MEARATHLTLRSLKNKAALVREVAAARSISQEIDILIWDVVITTDRRAAAATYLGELQERFLWVIDGEVTVDDLLDSPYLLFGTHEQIAEHLERLREEAGASRITVFPHLIDAFQPVLTRLREAP